MGDENAPDTSNIPVDENKPAKMETDADAKAEILDPKSEILDPKEMTRKLDEMNPTPLADKEEGGGKRERGQRGERKGGKNDKRDGRERERYIDRFKIISTKPSGMGEKRGGMGDIVNLHSNYIDVRFNSKDMIYQYQVEFEPQPGTRPRRFKIIRKWAETKQFVKEAYVFDGGSVLYTGVSGAAIIGEEKNELITVDGEEKQIRFRRTANLDNENPQALVLLNSQLNRFQEHELKMVRVQDNYYDPIGKLEPEGYQNRLEIWPGFETAIGVFEHNKILMSLDQRFRIIRKENAMDALRTAWGAASKTGADAEKCQASAAKAVIGCTIETSYNHLVYRVQGVDWTKSPAKTFETRVRTAEKWEKKEISFAEYYQNRYGVKVTDLKQPLLIVKPANKALRRKGQDQILLVPEFCRLTGYTDQIRQDFRLMQAVSKHTKLDPSRRKQATETFVKKLAGNMNIQKELKSWDVSYGTELVKFRGRALKPQPLSQRGKNFAYQAQNADWTQGMRGATFETPKDCLLWMVLCTERDKASAEAFYREIISVSQPMGMKFGNPRLIPLPTDRAEAYIEVVQKNFRPDLGLVLAIFPSNSKDRYDAFKETLCVNLPCASQVILGKTISGAPGKVKSVATKVALQINAKLGGDIWKMNFPFDKPTMVIGIDTHRDRTTSKTVVAAASGWNRGFSKYYNTASFANDDDDVLNLIGKIVKECVEDFNTRNKEYPKAVYIYRDGISEGQIGKIKDIELLSVKGVLDACSTQAKITLTYILVNKRESTRFFLDQNGPVGNPLSGTVVDDTVTRPWRYDFYIVSQTVREGTVAPTYYNVIEDTGNLKPEHLQQMTYMLCHMYYNWPGTIRVPAPVQYARKHAQLIALNLHKTAAPALRDRMFYL